MAASRNFAEAVRWASAILAKRDACAKPLREARRLYALAEEQAGGACMARLFEELVQRRARHEPFSYLLGEQEFMGRSFTVAQEGKRVLIPREDTEVLVKSSLAAAKADWKRMIVDNEDTYNVVELGCGSGAVLLSLLSLLNSADIPSTGIGIDCSADAIAISELNAERMRQLQVSAACPVTFQRGDWLAELDLSAVDMIVSNPPYISSEEFAGLDNSVKDFEPSTALLADNEGLEHYVTIARQVEKAGNPSRLKHILFEVGHLQAASVEEILRKSFSTLCLANVSHHQDLSGIARVVAAEFATVPV